MYDPRETVEKLLGSLGLYLRWSTYSKKYAYHSLVILLPSEKDALGGFSSGPKEELERMAEKLSKLSKMLEGKYKMFSYIKGNTQDVVQNVMKIVEETRRIIDKAVDKLKLSLASYASNS